MRKPIILALISGAAFGLAGIGLKSSAQEWQYWDRQDRNDHYGPRYSERPNRDYYYDGPRASERSNRDSDYERRREYFGNYGPYYRMERPSNNRRRVSRPYPSTYAYPFSYAYPVYVYPPLYAYPPYYPYAYPYAPYYYGIPAIGL
jgi:hypothetical protein